MLEGKYLPIGTVVLLKEGKKRIMITGYMSMEKEKKEMYDYSGCLYPEGIISSDQFLLFNHDQIERIYYKGLVDEESIDFNNKLIELEKNLKGMQ